jgi:TrmH family RNA methyltransferase
MGSLFNLPLAQVDEADSLFAWLESRRLRVVGADATRGNIWTTLDWRGGVALVLGNEAQGLSDDLYPHIAEWAALPIHGKAESLNVAVAGGVLMYAWAAANW